LDLLPCLQSSLFELLINRPRVTGLTPNSFAAARMDFPLQQQQGLLLLGKAQGRLEKA